MDEVSSCAVVGQGYGSRLTMDQANEKSPQMEQCVYVRDRSVVERLWVTSERAYSVTTAGKQAGSESSLYW